MKLLTLCPMVSKAEKHTLDKPRKIWVGYHHPKSRSEKLSIRSGKKDLVGSHRGSCSLVLLNINNKEVADERQGKFIPFAGDF